MAKAKTMLLRLAGRTLGRFITHVAKTSQLIYEPKDFFTHLYADPPFILAFWHGQFMMLPYMHDGRMVVKAMVARHGDAELIGEALKAHRIELIRGAGAGERKKDRGGASALRAALDTLGKGEIFAMTADVPPGPARIAGSGIVTIARLSGRPVLPVACASSRFRSLDTWSRMTVNLPHSKLAFVLGDPIYVASDADAAAQERARIEIETALNRVTARAYERAGADITRATPLELLPPGPPSEPGLAIKTYRAATAALSPAASLMLSTRGKRGKEDQARRGERFGVASIPRPAGRIAWVHAASVGETMAALPVIEAMLARYPALNVLLTSGTTTSAALAGSRLPDRAVHQYLPIDVPAYMRRFLDYWQPNIAVLTESEIWPNLILETSARGVPLALINARMSPRSMKRWRQHARLARPLFSRFAVALAQNEKIAHTLRALGVQKVIAAGNLKADAPPPPVDAAELTRLRSALGRRPCFVAASTHPGEEAIVAEAHKILARDLPGLLTIIVPRHPERAAELQTAISQAGLKVTRRSVTGLPAAETEIYLADTIGELGTFYALAPVALIGGSLVERGGQNPIEAVRHGAAVLTGPHRHNFRDSYAALLSAGGAREVRTADDLAKSVLLLLTDEAASRKMRAGAETAVTAMSGALEKTIVALAAYLDTQGAKERAA